jgi:hypothetical protein
MQIFDEILKQYVQLAAKNTQYKNSFQSLKFNDISPASNNFSEVNFKTQNSNLLDSYYEISIEKVVKNEF